MLNFIYGYLAASLISAIALVCYDCHESDFTFYLAGGPVLWIIGLFCWAYQTISRKAIYSNCRSVFEDVAGRLWYCDRKFFDTLLEYSDKYHEPDIMKYQDYVKLWPERFKDNCGKYFSVSFHYAPKKFWKKYAKPMPMEDIWKAQNAQEISRG